VVNRKRNGKNIRTLYNAPGRGGRGLWRLCVSRWGTHAPAEVTTGFLKKTMSGGGKKKRKEELANFIKGTTGSLYFNNVKGKNFQREKPSQTSEVESVISVGAAALKQRA